MNTRISRSTDHQVVRDHATRRAPARPPLVRGRVRGRVPAPRAGHRSAPIRAQPRPRGSGRPDARRRRRRAHLPIARPVSPRSWLLVGRRCTSWCARNDPTQIPGSPDFQTRPDLGRLQCQREYGLRRDVVRRVPPAKAPQSGRRLSGSAPRSRARPPLVRLRSCRRDRREPRMASLVAHTSRKRPLCVARGQR